VAGEDVSGIFVFSTHADVTDYCSLAVLFYVHHLKHLLNPSSILFIVSGLAVLLPAMMLAK
jgi:hypothetical protein